MTKIAILPVTATKMDDFSKKSYFITRTSDYLNSPTFLGGRVSPTSYVVPLRMGRMPDRSKEPMPIRPAKPSRRERKAYSIGGRGDGQQAMCCERSAGHLQPCRTKIQRGFQYTRQDSNLQPSVPKTDALSSCATGAKLANRQKLPLDSQDHSKSPVAFEGLSFEESCQPGCGRLDRNQDPFHSGKINSQTGFLREAIGETRGFWPRSFATG